MIWLGLGIGFCAGTVMTVVLLFLLWMLRDQPEDMYKRPFHGVSRRTMTP